MNDREKKLAFFTMVRDMSAAVVDGMEKGESVKVIEERIEAFYANAPKIHIPLR